MVKDEKMSSHNSKEIAVSKQNAHYRGNKPIDRDFNKLSNKV